MSQVGTVADLLRQHGGLTDAVALSHGVTEVRKRVYQLRQRGWRITTCHEPDHLTGHYVLIAAPGEPPRQIGLEL